MWVRNSAGKRYYVPREMEEYVYKKRSLFIESISPELAEAQKYDANGRRTIEGKVLEEIKTRFPDVGVDDVEYEDKPHTVVQEEQEQSTEVSEPDNSIIVDSTWTKKEIVTYLIHLGTIDGKDEETHMRMLKDELIALANGKQGEAEN
jgi:hypothetical protein